MLSTVETVDSASKGIKIKMIDLEGEANKYLKNGDNSINLDGNYGNGTIKNNLLERRLGTDGYPIAKNGAKVCLAYLVGQQKQTTYLSKVSMLIQDTMNTVVLKIMPI